MCVYVLGGWGGGNKIEACPKGVGGGWGNKIEACPGGGGGGGGGGKQNRSLSRGAGIYKSVSGDIINACSVVLNPGGGGFVYLQLLSSIGVYC